MISALERAERLIVRGWLDTDKIKVANEIREAERAAYTAGQERMREHFVNKLDWSLRDWARRVPIEEMPQ